MKKEKCRKCLFKKGKLVHKKAKGKRTKFFCTYSTYKMIALSEEGVKDCNKPEWCPISGNTNQNGKASKLEKYKD